MKGTQPKSYAELAIAGTLRPSRHGKEDTSPQIEGKPEKPEWITGDAGTLWELITTSYGDAGPLTRLDSAILALACDMWAKYRAASAAAESGPTDKVLRSAVIAYASSFEKLAGRLGLNPVDRRRLKAEASKTDSETERKASYFK